MSTIDTNDGTSAAPVAETAIAFTTTNVTITSDSGTPAGQFPTAYIAASAALFGTVNITSENGAQVFVSEPVNVAGAINLYADGGTITLGATSAGALGNTTAVIENGGTLVGSGGTLAGLLNGGGISFGTGGGTLDISSGSSLLNLSGAAAISGYSNGDVVVDGDVNYANVANYSIANSGGNQVVTFYNTSGTSLGSLTFANGTFSKTGTFASNAGPLQLAQSPAGDVELMTCFLAGTHIATAAGDVTVEMIRAGDMVATLVDGEAELKPVTWIGRRTVAVSRDAPDELFPVRISAGAISDDCPRRDLLVTSDHCIFIDGVLVPARMLVNGGSIKYARELNVFTYFHIELEHHAILSSEGLTSESYLDTGNRAVFDDGAVTQLNAAVAPLAAKDWAKDAAAPLAVDQARVEPIWRRLQMRVRSLGWLAEPPVTIAPRASFDVHLLTSDGLKIRPYQITGGIYGFTLPAGVSAVSLMSETARPCDIIGPYVDDRRRLGLLVGEVTLLTKRGAEAVSEHLQARELSGWHVIEVAQHRWTNGSAVLPLNFAALAEAPGLLKIQLLSLGPVAPVMSPMAVTGGKRAA